MATIEEKLFEVTALVLTLNVAEVLPEVIVTDGGTVATAVLLEVSLTLTPAAGAGPLLVTVPIEDAPPFTVVGFSVNDLSEKGVSVSVAEMPAPLYVAEMLTRVVLLSGLLFTVKVA